MSRDSTWIQFYPSSIHSEIFIIRIQMYRICVPALSPGVTEFFYQIGSHIHATAVKYIRMLALINFKARL